jgi:hypothetical protein
MLHHAGNVFLAGGVRQRFPFRGRFRMDLDAAPRYIQLEFAFERFDDALADVTEGSDIVGKNQNRNRHKYTFIRTDLIIQDLHVL